MDHVLIQCKIEMICREDISFKEILENDRRGEHADMLWDRQRDFIGGCENITAICKITIKQLLGKKMSVMPILCVG